MTTARSVGGVVGPVTPEPTPGSGAPQESKLEVRALGCPRCGGGLEIREGAALVRCAYCGGAFLARTPDGTFRFVVPPMITREAAETAVRRTFHDPSCASDLAEGATRVSCDLFFVPFWRFRATFAGRVRGTRDVVARMPTRVYHTDTEGFSVAVDSVAVRVAEEEVVEEIQEIWKATITASPLDDLGIPRLSSRRQLPGGLERLSAGAGEIPGLTLLGKGAPAGVLIDPMIPLEEARREADLVFDRFVHGRGCELRDKNLVCERLQNRESLVFYPVYRVRYQYRGRIFDATVEALDGRLVRAFLPARRDAELAPLVLGACGGGFLLGAAIRPLFAALATGGIGAGLAGLLGAALLAAGWVYGLRRLAGRFARQEDDIVLAP